MSRNFELLRKLSEHQQVFAEAALAETPAAPQPSPGTAARTFTSGGVDARADRFPQGYGDSPTLHAQAEAQAYRTGKDEHEAPLRAESRRSEPAFTSLVESHLDDEVVQLVQRLFLMSKTERTARIVVFSAFERNRRSSELCATVAAVLASAVPDRVCAVDGNLRSPSLHRCFAVDRHRGVTDLLQRKASLRTAAHPVASNLWVLSGGRPVLEPHTLVTPERAAWLTNELRSNFDYVLIDVPPLQLAQEGVLLGKLADGMVLLVTANTTRRELARRAKEQLDAAGVRLLGAVLTDRTFPIPDAIYRRV